MNKLDQAFAMKPRPTIISLPDQEILKRRYLSIYEAVSLLTNCFKEGFFMTLVSPMEEGALQKPFQCYLPDNESTFDPKTFGTNYKKIFLSMRKFIESGGLEAQFGYYNNITTYLICPRNVILWALHKEILLPKNLQRVANFYLMDDQTATKCQKIKVRKKIIAQYHLNTKPRINQSEIVRYILKLESNPPKKISKDLLKATTRAVSELFKSPGQPGRPPKSINERPQREHITTPLPEIVLRNEAGINYFHIPYLKIALTTAIQEKIQSLGDEKLRKMSLSHFFSEILEDSTVKLYLEEASDIAMEFFQTICQQVIGEWLLAGDLFQKLFSLEDKGIRFEWPIDLGKCKLFRSAGKIGLF